MCACTRQWCLSAGPELLRMEPTDAGEKLANALWVTKSFKAAYEATRMHRYVRLSKWWDFQSAQSP